MGTKTLVSRSLNLKHVGPWYNLNDRDNLGPFCILAVEANDALASRAWWLSCLVVVALLRRAPSSSTATATGWYLLRPSLASGVRPPPPSCRHFLPERYSQKSRSARIKTRSWIDAGIVLPAVNHAWPVIIVHWRRMPSRRRRSRPRKSHTPPR